jgi:repressor LexA
LYDAGMGDTEHHPLTVRQHQVLTVIHDWIARRGYPPTVREIGKAVGLGSSSSVNHHVKALERKGLLRRDAHGPRALAIGARAGAAEAPPVRVPVLGTIAAGEPILAEEQADEDLALPAALVGHDPVFALHVKGDSMIEAAICDGDIVVVRQQPEAQTGDIVAAMIDDEATVKVYRKTADRVELVPRNPHYPVLDGGRAKILGKVICVLRRV